MANALRLRRALFLSSSLLPRSTAAAASSAPLLRVPASSPSPAASNSFPQLGSRAFHSSVSSPYSYQSQRSNHQADDHIDENTILFEGCDYKHWLITMDFPKDPRPSPEEMVETYVQTLAKVVGSVEEAKRRMYACSTTTYTGFQAEIDEETANKFEGMPGVVFVLPDSYIDPVNKEYGGDKYINGTIIPRPPPVQYGRQRRQRPQEGSGYNRQGPPQEGFGYNRQGPPQEGSGYNRQGPPLEGSGYNRQGPPQEGSGYNRQGPPQEGSGYNRQGPPLEGSGYNRQGPPRDAQNFTPPQSQAPRPNYSPQQNYGPPQSYPPRGNQGPSQNYPPQQNYTPTPNFPPQQSYVPPPRQGERMDTMPPRSPDRFQGDRAGNFPPPPPPSGVPYGRGGPGSYGQNPGGSFQVDRAGSPPPHQGNYNQGSDYPPRYQRTDNLPPPPPPPPPGVQYEHNPRGSFGNQSSDSYGRQANTSYGQGYAGPGANQPQGGEQYGAGQRDQRTYGPPTGLPGTDQGRY